MDVSGHLLASIDEFDDTGRMTTENPAPLLTPKEAAARLAITVKHLTELIRTGAIAYINVGRGNKNPRRRFTEADIEDFIERHRRREVCLPPTRNIRRRSSSISDMGFPSFTALRAARLAEKLEKQKR